jgi:TfoX/Sxy family transcriptional regulator of competence genes
LFDKNPEEHYIKEGDPKKPTYYIIRRMSENTGLLTHYRLVMGHVCYALSKGWLPVVDMQNYANPYLAPEKLGKENAWEYYFEQPFRVNLEQAYNGDNVVLSNGDCVKPYPDYSMNLAQKKNEELIEWRMLIKMGFLQIKPTLTEEIATLRPKLFSLEENIIAVILRGNDYTDKKIKGRPIPPPIEFATKTVGDKFRDWACDKILLMTKDNSVAETFKNNFGDRCVLLDQVYSVCYDTDKDNLANFHVADAKDEYFLKGEEHLAQAILLSGCKSFIAEKCNDTTSVMLLANKFEHMHFFNLGNY